MIYFMDTSSLVKRYSIEEGSDNVDRYFDTAEDIFISPITKLETHSAVRRILEEKIIDQNTYQELINEINYDFKYYQLVEFNEILENEAHEIIRKYQLKTLDAIQLASCVKHKQVVDSFICCDNKLIDAAEKEGIRVINPIE